MTDETKTEEQADAATAPANTDRSPRLTMEQRFIAGWVVSAESRGKDWRARITDGENAPEGTPKRKEFPTRELAYEHAEEWCTNHPRWVAGAEAAKPKGLHSVDSDNGFIAVMHEYGTGEIWRTRDAFPTEEDALMEARRRCREKERDFVDSYIARRRAEVDLFPKLAKLYERIGDLTATSEHHATVVKECKKEIDSLQLQARDLVREVHSPQLRLSLEDGGLTVSTVDDDPPDDGTRKPPKRKGGKGKSDKSHELKSKTAERAAATEAIADQAEQRRPGIDPTNVRWPEEQGAPLP